MAHVPPEARRGLRGYARDVGLAFQIADDLLDVEGDETRTGKALHKDADAGKETFVLLLGAERAREQARMLVQQAKDHLHIYGVEADLLRAIADYVRSEEHTSDLKSLLRISYAVYSLKKKQYLTYK